jgi:tetratricopeptide (TPR) repeat protein
MSVLEKTGFLNYHLLKLLGIGCAVVGFALATIWTLRIGLADIYFQRHTLIGTEKAIRLTPGQAEYYDHLAGYLADTDERQATQALKHAVALDPYDATTWIQLGLLHEAGNRLQEASQCLHQAAHVDHTFLPAWSLANFYFRQNNSVQFWFWIHQASRLVPEDASPLFRLCWHFTDDGTEIGQQLDLSRPDMLTQYLNFLIADNRMAAVGPMALRLIARNRSQDTALLLNTSDWLISQHQATAALNIWNCLAEQHRIPFHAIHPQSNPAVTNADFIRSPTSIGFDWHLPTVPGINASQESGLGGLRLEFSSDQPESTEILTQVLAVQPNTAYSFMFDYSTLGIAPGTGLTWRVTNLGTGSVLASTESLSADKGAVGHLDFKVPADSRFVRLSLVYQRALGTTRIEGSLVLHRTGLATADSSKTEPSLNP